MTYLVTGAVGFIGFHAALSLLKDGETVVGYDCINDYYDRRYKFLRQKILSDYPKFTLVQKDLTDKPALEKVFQEHHPHKVLHLAAQAGVRYSLVNPMAYIKSNIEGFQNVIDLAKDSNVANFVYASSSSVYGGNTKLPFAEQDPIINPISLYAASKISNELVAKTYNHLYQLPTTGLRFFTVYGPYGRPDMAMFKFAANMKQQQPIAVYNFGEMQRDFTYIDDIIQGVRAALDHPSDFEIYNLARGQTESLMDMIHLLAEQLGIKPKIEFHPMQQGDVKATYGDITHAKDKLGFDPQTSIGTGISNFVQWFESNFMP